MRENVTDTAVPVNVLWENILMVSIFGVLDSHRAQQLMESMLDRIMHTESKVIILDIAGVPMVDTAVGNHLIHISKATKLMGCDCIISGISPSIAQTMVHLGVELGDVLTTSTLAAALGFAFDRLGLRVEAKVAEDR